MMEPRIVKWRGLNQGSNGRGVRWEFEPGETISAGVQPSSKGEGELWKENRGGWGGKEETGACNRTPFSAVDIMGTSIWDTEEL